MGTILGVPVLRIIVFWGLYWGPPILGNYHILQVLLSKYLKDYSPSPKYLIVGYMGDQGNPKAYTLNPNCKP